MPRLREQYAIEEFREVRLALDAYYSFLNSFAWLCSVSPPLRLAESPSVFVPDRRIRDFTASSGFSRLVRKLERLVEKLEMENATSMTDE